MGFWSLEGPKRYDAKLSKPLFGKLRGSSGLFYIKKKEMNFQSVWKVLWSRAKAEKKNHAVAAE